MKQDRKLTAGSQTFLTAVLLSVCGGMLDAYTYYTRGGVFANAQTGNIIKLGLRIAEGDFHACIRYLISIAAFIAGVFCVLLVEHILTMKKIRYIRRSVIALEITGLVICGMIPAHESTDIIANSIISFVCAMQMEAFRAFEGQAYATTVSTGNLRKAVEYLFRSCVSKKAEDRSSAFRYLIIVSAFVGGVIAGALFSFTMNIRTVLIPAGILFFLLGYLTIRYRQIIRQEKQA